MLVTSSKPRNNLMCALTPVSQTRQLMSFLGEWLKVNVLFTVNLVKESMLSLKHQPNHCLFRLRSTFYSNWTDENIENKRVFLWTLWPFQLTQIRSCKFLFKFKPNKQKKFFLSVPSCINEILAISPCHQQLQSLVSATLLLSICTVVYTLVAPLLSQSPVSESSGLLLAW